MISTNQLGWDGLNESNQPFALLKVGHPTCTPHLVSGTAYPCNSGSYVSFDKFKIGQGKGLKPGAGCNLGHVI
jgi:hypothetical protein